MKRAAVPKALQTQLGDEATDGLVELFNKQQAQMTDDIVRAVVRELEPRFAAIEARLDRCATKDDLRDLGGHPAFRAFATKDDLRAFATKEHFSVLRVEMAEGFGRLRGDMAAQHAEMMKWMFVFWVGQAFVVLAYFRIGQYLAAP